MHDLPGVQGQPGQHTDTSTPHDPNRSVTTQNLQRAKESDLQRHQKTLPALDRVGSTMTPPGPFVAMT
ncbi:hypothetical protein GCM10022224_102850 [Nonomuraea antimicrobica]|uniref:Uncharacterized protein n=1 Tax=Nonomuraea antimicrobica TaxID=561173 RepID=A0ABP7EQH7_9ACTN